MDIYNEQGLEKCTISKAIDSKQSQLPYQHCSMNQDFTLQQQYIELARCFEGRYQRDAEWLRNQNFTVQHGCQTYPNPQTLENEQMFSDPNEQAVNVLEIDGRFVQSTPEDSFDYCRIAHNFELLESVQEKCLCHLESTRSNIDDSSGFYFASGQSLANEQISRLHSDFVSVSNQASIQKNAEKMTHPTHLKGRKIRAPRKVYKQEQLDVLNKVFARSPYIDLETRSMLATSIGVSQLQVKVWFQNKRSTVKQMKKKVILNGVIVMDNGEEQDSQQNPV